MTFEEWLNKTFPTHADHVDTSKISNYYFIKEAFEAGYNACIDELLISREGGEWIEVHKETLEGVKK